MSTILVIDDNAGIRQSLSELLGLENWQVLEAPNGVAGAKMALERQPDLILCDVNLPLLDGFGVLELLHGDEKTARIPFLLMTAAPELRGYGATRNITADRIIAKPFDITTMLDAIKRCLPQ